MSDKKLPESRFPDFQLNFINEKSFLATPGETLLCQALKNEIPHVHECGGKGLCSTCRVIVEDGLEHCSPETAAENLIRQSKNLPSYIRLACQTIPRGPVSIRRLVRDNFDIRSALENGLTPSAESQDLAIMFTDIRNFTEFSQQHLPYDITHMLNRYFNAMTDVVQHYGGYVDKLLGDGMMVLFGLDKSRQTHPCDDALQAAQQMQLALEQLNQYFLESFDYLFKIGIGIDFGSSLTGYFGSKNDQSFTALGPSVNRAARIEALCKTYQCTLLISDEVKSHAREQYSYTECYDVHLKGIKQSTRVWGLISPIPAHQGRSRFEEELFMDIKPDNLPQVIGSPAIAVAASYQGDNLVLYIGQASLYSDNSLSFYMPGGHQLKTGDYLTLHLDNRTGVDEFDADLRVYRTSYKGLVTATENEYTVHIAVRDFSLVHGMSEVLAERQPDYGFPPDGRPVKALPVTPLTDMPELNHEEHDNKIGVLVTRTPEQPHTTAMAFLSTSEDDIFIISFPSTFKVQQLQKDNRCYFAIDERASFTFENAIDWNYVLIAAEAYEVPVDHLIYQPVKSAFIDKNPWEIGFFADPNVRLYHLKCLSTVCPARA
ncbi:adenylate/guanylate cyclase domain-containing protein [Oceanospirillum sediminis]|uniref:2Fe-2S iron-sulfur cluster binding domain-containing protein n=1 Tax=Oceanospirillum sediminis TaxID=2760088 RepID=A0A839IK49_9GAMM|nr:adenylate/guanylate cyclase domain-containing protein [Oceanospirillum sediminis]MBB1485100.1 2Fe-2S iron-sulfur cluster binding domain-containing protein [Oceanospirillum sediminis]